MEASQLQQGLTDQRDEQRVLVGAVPGWITAKYRPTFNVRDLSAIADPVMVETVIRDAADAVVDAEDGAVRDGLYGRREWLARRAAADVLNNVAHDGDAAYGINAAQAALKAFGRPGGNEPKMTDHEDALITFIALVAAADTVAERGGV